jgi:hypothetical protein
MALMILNVRIIAPRCQCPSQYRSLLDIAGSKSLSRALRVDGRSPQLVLRLHALWRTLPQSTVLSEAPSNRKPRGRSHRSLQPAGAIGAVPTKDGHSRQRRMAQYTGHTEPKVRLHSRSAFDAAVSSGCRCIPRPQLRGNCLW